MKTAYRWVTGASDDTPSMTPGENGYLEKLGGASGRQWQKRYFERDGGTLKYYKNPGGELLGTLGISGCTVYSPTKNKPAAAPKLHTMELVDVSNDTKGTTKSYFLAADSSDELKGWISAIESYVASDSVISGTSLKDRAAKKMGGGDSKDEGGEGGDGGKKKDKKGEKPSFEGLAAEHLEKIWEALGEKFTVEYNKENIMAADNYSTDEDCDRLVDDIMSSMARGVDAQAKVEVVGEYFKDGFLGAAHKRKFRVQTATWESRDYSHDNLLGYLDSYVHTIFDAGVCLIILNNKGGSFCNINNCISHLHKAISIYEEYGDQGRLDGFEWGSTPSMPSMGMPSMPDMPDAPSMPSLSKPSMPSLSKPSMPSFKLPSVGMPSRPKLPGFSKPDLDAPDAPKEEEKAEFPYPHPFTTGVPYMLRRDIAENLEKFYKHLERINEVSGVEWEIEIPFDITFRQVIGLLPEKHDDYGERLGDYFLDSYVGSLAWGMEAFCKNEMKKAALLGATSQRKICFFIQEPELDQYDWEKCPRGSKDRYCQPYFDQGILFIAIPIARFPANASNCTQYWAEAISVWEELGDRCNDPEAVKQLSCPGMPGMPGVPDLSLPERPSMPGLPSTPSLPEIKRPTLSLPSVPAAPDLSLPSWDSLPSLEAAEKEVCSEACHSSMAIEPKHCPLLLRLSVEDNFKNRANNIRKINEATGEEYHVTVDFKHFQENIPPEDHQTFERLGGIIFDSCLGGLAWGVERICKEKKDLFVEKTSSRMIKFEKTTRENLQELREPWNLSSTYVAIRIEDGDIICMIGEFCNLSDLGGSIESALQRA